jgi:chromosome segregation ATPase
MEIWPIIQQNAISILSGLVTAVGVYFGARSYFLAERKKQNEEISRIKQLLVGSSEVSVQNLTEVIESLRGRVDRLEADRSRIRELLDDERKRARELEEKKTKLMEDMAEARKRVEDMEQETRRLSRELRMAQDKIQALRDTRVASLSLVEGVDWAPPPYR